MVEEACRVAAKVLRFVSSTEPLNIDSSGWTDEEVESIKTMLHECSATVQIPVNILSGGFVDSNKMVPLTLEQLREMDGQPVWIVRLEDKLGWWAIVRLRNDRANTDYGAYFMLSDYGKTWIAYTYPPVHIDREAWDDCPVCGSNKVIEFKAWKKPEYIIGGPFTQGGAMFCPRCGKPRTPKAWAELDKRLRG